MMDLIRRVKNLYKLRDTKLRVENLAKGVFLLGYPTTTAWQINRMHKEHQPETYPGKGHYVKKGIAVQSTVLILHAMIGECAYHIITKYL